MTTTPRTILDQLVADLAGQRVPGGCESCDSWQTLDEHHGIFRVRVHHDDGCPVLAEAAA